MQPPLVEIMLSTRFTNDLEPASMLANDFTQGSFPSSSVLGAGPASSHFDQSAEKSDVCLGKAIEIPAFTDLLDLLETNIPK